jgi:Response regulator containing a CheY-like receiver domain and an HTH DNA-binding domain
LIRVAIFEDNKHLREGLQILINGTPGFTCVGAYPDCSNLVAHLKANQADIALMDIEMPGMTGIEATRIIKASLPHVQVLIQTVFFDDDYIFKAICAGASGYILKSTTPAAYIEAIRDVHSGGSPMTAGIARRVIELFKENLAPPSANNYQLSEKEKEVLQNLVDGKSYKMIADAMNIAFDTVKTHIKNIYAKLHVHSSAEAVAKAIRERIV